MNRLAPSILSSDFSELADQVGIIEKGGADIIHVDVMDGHFVPNISYGSAVMKSLLGKTEMPFNVHLMIEDPDRYMEDFMTENTEYITVHQEACVHLNRTLQHIKNLGAKAGVALNPATPVKTLDCVWEDVDMVLLMSVNPGFGGQTFISSVMDKIKETAQIRAEKKSDFVIEVDGGITLDNVTAVKKAGTDIFVAGSSVFKTPDPAKTTAEFIRKIKE